MTGSSSGSGSLASCTCQLRLLAPTRVQVGLVVVRGQQAAVLGRQVQAVQDLGRGWLGQTTAAG